VSQHERYTRWCPYPSVPLRVSRAPFDLTLSTLDSLQSLKASREPVDFTAFRSALVCWHSFFIQHTRKALHQHETQYKEISHGRKAAFDQTSGHHSHGFCPTNIHHCRGARGSLGSQRSGNRILHQGQQRQGHSEQPTFDLGFKTWVRPHLLGPRTGSEDTMRSTRFWRDSGLSFERAAVGSWIAVGAPEEVVAT
jgi:hypothetical protein